MTDPEAAEHIVLITGANQGVGFEIARQLGSHQGYHVLMGSRDAARGATAAKTLSSEGLSVDVVQVDVTDDDSIARAAETVRERFGRLDVLIHNAGISEQPLGKDGRNLRQVMQAGFDTNLFGVAQMTETFLPLIRQSTHPRIVFITSRIGSLAMASASPPSNFISLPMYRTSKAALNMLMLHYATTLQDQGVKVNASCPGFCATNMNGFAETGAPPADGAINAVRLVVEGTETGTFTHKDGTAPW
ncbi:MAG: hypothetical protein M1837_003562 [Sclerophora amabilis]|nr:MAG: hypothetical protein M1837_003562 [Sclerophora amabilis]